MDELLREVKAVAVRIMSAAAHSAKQAHVERFQAFPARARGLTIDCQYVLPCPHMPDGKQVCGVDYTPKGIKDILLSGICNQDVRREVLGDSSVEDKSVNELVRFETGHRHPQTQRPRTREVLARTRAVASRPACA